MPPSGALECRGKAPETEPTPEPTPIPTIREWARLLHTHTHEEFVALAFLHKDHSCPPCLNVSGAALIRPSQIHHYVFGSWQDTLDVHECLEGIFRLLQLDPTISLHQLEIDQILCLEEAPTRWTRARHFPPLGDPTHMPFPLVVARGTTVRDTSSRFICTRDNGPSSTPSRRTFLNLPSCNIGSIEL